MVERIRHIECARAIYRDAGGVVEAGRAAGAVGTARSKGQTVQRGHAAGGGDFADKMVALIGHIDIAATIHRHSTRAAERTHGRKETEARGSAEGIGEAAGRDQPGERADPTTGANFPNREITRVRHIKIAELVNGNSLGCVESSICIDRVIIAAANT